MLFAFLTKRKMRKVLEAADGGILSAKEIASRARVSESKTMEMLRHLETTGYLVSGYLMPVGLKIYRVTLQGQDALAKDAAI